MTIYSLDVLLFLFGTKLLFHVQFSLLLLDLHTDFSGGRSGDPVFAISWRIFHSLLWSTQSKAFDIVNKAEVDVFLELSWFFDDPVDVGNLISGSSVFSKSSLNIWKLTVYILLKAGLENFEHCFTSMWDECNGAAVWAFFGIAFFLGLEWKLTFSSPVATAEFSKFAVVLSAALSQHHLLWFEIAQLEFHHLH